MEEYLRPWKLATFAAGLALLIAGSFYYRASDWDVGVSLLMGTLAYLTAPRVYELVKERRWSRLPGGLFAYWLSVDGSYVLYNAWRGIPIGPELRRENLFASTLLYLLCAWLWAPRQGWRQRWAWDQGGCMSRGSDTRG